MAVYACIGLVGGIIGGLLLLELPAKVFEFAVPPLILFSALIIALNPRKKAAARDAVAQALPQSHQGERAARIASKTADGTLRNDPWWLWAGVSPTGGTFARLWKIAALPYGSRAERLFLFPAIPAYSIGFPR